MPLPASIKKGRQAHQRRSHLLVATTVDEKTSVMNESVCKTTMTELLERKISDLRQRRRKANSIDRQLVNMTSGSGGFIFLHDQS
jgi:hypothetical protein